MHAGTGNDPTHDATDDDEALFEYLFGTANDAEAAPDLTRWADRPA